MKAQYDFDALYVMPFTQKRGFNEQKLMLTMVPLEVTRKRTGVDVLDAVVDCLAEGRDPHTVAFSRGMTTAQLSTILRGLTGLGLQQMVTRWRLRRVDDLLSYTELPLREIMSRCGFTSATAFSRFVRTRLGASPVHYRIAHRQAGDIGKYAL